MKRYTFLFLLTVFMLSAVYCSKHDDAAPDHQPMLMKGEEGKSVFAILLENHEVDYKESDMGVFINSIDGIKNQGGHFWVYSINGTPGKVAADKAIVSEGDKIEWRYK